jgi:hypothetical protein
MLPGSPPVARRRRIVLVIAAIFDCGYAAFTLLTGAATRLPGFVPFACVVIGNAAVVFVGWRGGDELLVPAPAARRGSREGGGVGRGLAGDAGETPTGAGRHPVLRAAARLMPPAPGSRWLAEADSLLSEVPAGRRGTFVRSYLLSVPRLVLMMWAAKLSRRPRPRSRHPR